MQTLKTMANGRTIEVDHGDGNKDYITTDKEAAQKLENNPVPQNTQQQAQSMPEDVDNMLAIPDNVRQ